YSGVTLGLMHGSLPHAMVLCSQPTRSTVQMNDWIPVPPLKEMVELHERMMSPLRASRVVGLCLNTFGMSDADASAAVERASQETGLPATDPVRFDPGPV